MWHPIDEAPQRICTRTHAVVGTQPATLAAAGSSQTSARKLVRNNQIQMIWLIINLKDIPTGRKLMTWSWTNAVQIQKKIKEIWRMSWNGKNETSRKKSGVMKIEHYSKTCWLREEEARHFQLQIHKLRAFNNKSVSSKTWKNSHFGSWPIVRWVIGSFEFLTRDYFLFVDWTRVVWATWVVPLYDRDCLPCSRKPKSFADVVLDVERA